MPEKEKFLIAGPCSAESAESIEESAQAINTIIKNSKIALNKWWLRASLEKPRTSPGFEGASLKGIPWLVKIASEEIGIATELMQPQTIEPLLNSLSEHNNSSSLIVWLGSRNQNHRIQTEISRRLMDSSISPLLMIKNQPWGDESHWLGIVDHVLSTGFPLSRLILYHRGFYPYRVDNPHNLRNIPDFEMAIRVKEKTGLPLILDPSHIAGSQEKVTKVINMAQSFPFDGYMIEVHPNPSQAKSDSQQQLTFAQFGQALKLIN